MGRLFWKILLAFWLTFLAITQGVWLLFELSRSHRAPPEMLLVEQVAPVALSAAADAVAKSGPAGFAALEQQLPAGTQARLTLQPKNGDAGDVAGAGASAGGVARARARAHFHTIVRDVTAPDGQAYRIAFAYHTRPSPMMPLNTPPELLLVGMLAGLLFSAVLAWYLTEPINRLRLGFDRLARGDLGARVGPAIGRRRDEIADLGRYFDLMAQRLEQIVVSRDRLLHDVSHELRSPLARLQLAIGLARQSPTRTAASLDRIEQEARKLDTMVDELLMLSRAENGMSVGEDYFDMAAVVASVVEDARFEAQAKNVSIVLRENLPPEEQRVPLRGHAEMFRQAIDNIVRNALRYSSAGQAVIIEVSHSVDGAGYSIIVLDEGPGVAEEDLRTIFDPFNSGQRPGDGAGLGLAIAQRAIVAHGGKVVAENRVLGGLSIRVTLPDTL